MSIIKQIHTDLAPLAIGPYSQAVIVNNCLHTSGQIPLDPLTGVIVGNDIEEQTLQIMRNLSAILKEAGSSFEKVFKTTCFLADMADFVKFNEIYAEYFVSKPARSCVAVRTLPKNVKCEVELIAII
ncbi:RidA family protein [Klebsiella oxytoca]|uniref:RidA family protein n=1 Tax=Klebsiella TaxID=570 RepID=UPI001C38E448|nr:RidA family protein [Klebsiella pneumoniae]HBR1311127.1 RidA family protein [Klebsiella quasipneumoniae subsp. quasipneumoniae]HCJ7666354.1 RidA family protein [Enterobacter hormaechei subsp. xiangfangensis]HCM8069517.1 RidA family protein [Klebsiella variicola]